MGGGTVIYNTGSSPLTRGALMNFVTAVAPVGIIPADAGSTFCTF